MSTLHAQLGVVLGNARKQHRGSRFEILKVIGGKEKRWNAREVSEALGLNLATVHRFVITLERLGALTRDPNGYLHPGILLADICSDIVYDDLLANIITPHA